MIAKRGLAVKLSIYLLTAILLILFALLYYNYIVSRNLLLNDAQNDVQKLTELKVSQITNVLKDVENVPQNIAQIIEHLDQSRLDGMRNVIDEALANNPLIFGVGIALHPTFNGQDSVYYAPYLYSDSGSVVYKNLASEYRYTTRDWYIKAIDQNTGIWSEPYFDEGGGEVMMASYSVPLFYWETGTKKFAGVVKADISLIELQRIIQEIHLYDTGFGFLISSKGNILSWPKIDMRTEQRVHNVFDNEQSPEMTLILEQMMSGKSAIISLEVLESESSKDYWTSYASIPGPGWSLAIRFHEKVLYRGLDKLYLELIGIGLLGFIIIGLLILFISKRFVKPIEQLAFATRRIGKGDFQFSIPSFKSHDEISQLGKSFEIMQVELKEYITNLKTTTALKEKMESEINIAANIQQEMLPVHKPIPGQESFEYFGMLKPASQIGGDLYDFIIKEGYMYFIIGDVAGKGVPASLFMAKTLTLFRTKVANRLEPEQIAEEINRDLESNNPRSIFVTAFIGKLEFESGKIEYCNAGHNPPYIIRKERKLETIPGIHGLPLGSFPEVVYKKDAIKLLEEDTIILYTDGIPEAHNIQSDQYGTERFERLLSLNYSMPPKELAHMIMSDVDSFAKGTTQSDDITLFIAKFI